MERRKEPRRDSPREAVGDRVEAARPEFRMTTGAPRVKFEVFGEEIIEKRVEISGNSGRVYLPPAWVGRKVKIARID